MKYLKTFENKEVAKKYWLLPTDERYKDSLIQINCHEDLLNKFLDDTDRYNHKYIFICFDKNETINYLKWGLMYYRYKPYDEYLEINGYKFMGNVNIPDYELDAEKYNL